jgi:thiamine-monophosphate kinase
MIDVSDGLVADLGHICQRSGVAAEVNAADLPISAALRAVAERLEFDPVVAALAGGEDYELVMTVTEGDLVALRPAVGEAGSALTEIGRIVAGHGVQVVGAPPSRLDGWDHFRSDEAS